MLDAGNNVLHTSSLAAPNFQVASAPATYKIKVEDDAGNEQFLTAAALSADVHFVGVAPGLHALRRYNIVRGGTGSKVIPKTMGITQIAIERSYVEDSWTPLSWTLNGSALYDAFATNESTAELTTVSYGEFKYEIGSGAEVPIKIRYRADGSDSIHERVVYVLNLNFNETPVAVPMTG